MFKDIHLSKIVRNEESKEVVYHFTFEVTDSVYKTHGISKEDFPLEKFKLCAYKDLSKKKKGLHVLFHVGDKTTRVPDELYIKILLLVEDLEMGEEFLKNF